MADGNTMMRATALLVGAAVITMVVAAGTAAPSVPPATLLAADPAGALLDPADGTIDGFDGRLYPDPETGCIRPWREGDGEPIGPEDVRVPQGSPLDRPVQAQDPAPRPELFPETHRGPWPICEDEVARVHDGGSGNG